MVGVVYGRTLAIKFIVKEINLGGTLLTIDDIVSLEQLPWIFQP